MRDSGGKSALQALHILMGHRSPEIVKVWQSAGGQGIALHETVKDLTEALKAAQNSLCVIEESADLDMTATLSEVAAVRPDLPIIVLGRNLPVSAIRCLMGQAYWDLLDAEADAEAIAAAFKRLSDAMSETKTPPKAQPAKKTTHCWSFVSSVGGGGSTLLATETAYQLSQHKRGPKVCLIDLNFVDGSCATYLNCDANLSPALFQKNPEQIDQVFMDTMTTEHEYGFDLIAMPRWVETDIKPSKASILQCLNVACETYDYVIIDAPRWPTEWSDEVFLGSDEVVLVSELTVPALNASRQWAERFKRMEYPPSIRTVLNRRQKGMFGAKVTIEQAETALQGPVFASVRSDWPTALSAINLGRAIGDMKPGSTIPKDICDLIEQLKTGTSNTDIFEEGRAA